jgi:hypothetical protein
MITSPGEDGWRSVVDGRCIDLIDLALPAVRSRAGPRTQIPESEEFPYEPGGLPSANTADVDHFATTRPRHMS